MKYSPYPSYKPSGVAWLGDVPAGWEVKRLKTTANTRTSNVDKVPSEDELPVRLCNYTDVYYNDHIHPGLELMETTATAEEIQRFRLHLGDVVITKDSEEWDDIAVPALVRETTPDLVCGYHLAIIRPNLRKLLGAFLFRSLQSSAVNHQFQIAATGVTRYGLPKSAIGEALLPLPPIDEQRAIADFLDRQTGRIDTLIAKRRALIERLKEKRSALISRTVTRGLPPAAARAAGLDPHPPLKPSGVEWLGDVPEHWGVAKVKLLEGNDQSVVQTGPFGAQLHASDYVDEGVPLILIRNVNDFKIDDTEIPRISEEDASRLAMYRLQTGDLVFSRVGSVGRIALCTEKEDGWLISGQMLRLRLRNPQINRRYALYILGSEAGLTFVELQSVGSTRESINTDILRNIPILIPPLPEQRAIADFLDRQTAKIDRLVSLEEAVIDRLQEYRSALITAAVTGKIDVRERAEV
ncbi:restriction modification system DNA specificity domain protein [Methanofollis liminatans DSM 4140]|uniref:Restriction modification system DNA specificity domain protein n=1 Tax=Methanofollis liminatans DSM 4140 TaxID=28892 RepID=J1L5C1_9EURY|nr:restriction endonuclease subunit S [Methanofollis liminatans]EJG07975.1 restriction modification system DNA specificity domain protein [Methanofollis liminatans DSM 4140]